MSESRILVAVSSPQASQKLAPSIADLAKRLDGQVVVAHVAQQRNEDERESDARQRGEQSLRIFTEPLHNSGVTAEGVMLFSDDVPKAILNTAAARECTLIVLGLSGKGMVKRLFSGDIPAEIMRQANVPVMLCPGTWAGVV